MNIKQHKIAALKHARKLIANKQTGYVCIALGDYPLGKQSPVALDAVNYLHSYISEQLNGDGALDYWLLSNKNLKSISDVEKCWKFGSTYGKKIRQTRLNWIDWMLECYEGEK